MKFVCTTFYYITISIIRFQKAVLKFQTDNKQVYISYVIYVDTTEY